MSVFGWMNDQVLRMVWLNDLVGKGVEAVGLDPASRLGGSVQFFVYDVIKIFALLSVLIFVISWVQSHFPPERTRAMLGGRSGIGANSLAALLGTLTPFCSCSSIPLFIGFTAAGLPLAVTFSFLISSPLVDLASVILLASIFNWPIALAYVGVGLVVAVVGGTVIGRLGMEDQVAAFVRTVPVSGEAATLTRAERFAYARDQVAEIVRRVWPYVLIGVGIGAAIHNWIPADVISALIGQDKWWSVPVAVLVGIPMYADIFGTLPIAEALVGKGVGLGTVLAFMMAVTALSLPSLIMLRRVVKLPLLVTFTAVVTIGILSIGLIFNAISDWFI
ncbi:permease [Cereibacter sphaeroides]|uniref:permease n=1 Tax=Cereibacter sphaeroides TaxID=1063 RepID=UPI001F28EAC8|nr:permease [Cereibacter sphaeroides]MCE6959873.1 permease [Cereibacter sphaeroides]MCE6968660.1 permease [Cereibacter sphaeroides]MCE6974727.1 permease [Cereibacter sphaeroides]